MPAGYYEACAELEAAALEYRAAHPRSVFLFRSLPDYLLDPECMPIGNMSELLQFAGDDETREFLRWLDERTGNKCTIFQFRVVVVPMLNGAHVGRGGKA
jgi:hypothetical protein